MLKRGADVNRVQGLWIKQPEDFVNVFSHQAESFFTLTKSFFCKPLLRYVMGYAANHGDAYSIRAKAVVVFPNSAFTALRQDYHRALGDLGCLNVLKILVERRVSFLQ